MPKKLTAEDKLAKLTGYATPGYGFEALRGIILCPYGDPSHPYWPDRVQELCESCSKLDGSECVDEFLEAWDRAQDGNGSASAFNTFHPSVCLRVDRMREWRASKAK